MTKAERDKLLAEAAAVEKELDALRAGGVSEEGIAAFRRLYPQFKKALKWPDLGGDE